MKPVWAMADPTKMGSVHSSATSSAEVSSAAVSAAVVSAVVSSAESVVEAQPASTRLRLAATARIPAALLFFICSP
jgi:hypothetical protein